MEPTTSLDQRDVPGMNGSISATAQTIERPLCAAWSWLLQRWWQPISPFC